MTRFIAFVYGILAYVIFAASFLYAIGFVSGFVAPTTIDIGKAAPPSQAAVIDLLLLSFFALQHSVMARQGFKRWWTRLVPPAVERSTYVLASSLVLALLLWQWRPIPAIVWRTADHGLAAAVLGLAIAGWVIAGTSTFLIGHFEFFGLSQVTSHLAAKPMPAPKFRAPLYYRFVRHPLYLGFIIAFWATPVMTAGHLLFACVTTAYILLGTLLEERDLVALFGDEYRRYKTRVPMLLPWKRPL